MNSGIDGVPYTKLTYSTGEKKNYQYEVVHGNIQRKDPTTFDTYSYDYSQQAGIVSDEATHGGTDVALFAKGRTSFELGSLVSHRLQVVSKVSD